MTGLVALRNGEEIVMTARREVILSAGSLASPQLSMVSGIGPAAKLSPHGITVRQALNGEKAADMILEDAR